MEKQKTKMKNEAGTSRVSSTATLSSTSSPRTRVHWSSPPTVRGAATTTSLKPIASLALSPTTTSMSLTSRQASMVSLRTATSQGSSSTTTAASSAKIKANTSESNATAITTTTSSGSPASSSSSGGSAENESSSSTYLSAMPDSSSTACMASLLRNYVVHTSATTVSPMSTTTVGSVSNRHESTGSAFSTGSAMQGWTTMTWHSSTTALDEPLLTVATVNVRNASGTRNPPFVQFPAESLQHREGQRGFIPWEDTDDEVEPNAVWAHLAPLTAATGDCEPPADEDLSSSPVVGKCHSAPCTSGYGLDRTLPLLRIADGASTLSLVQRSSQVPALRRLPNTPPSISRGIPQPPGLPVGQAITATRQTGEPNAWPPRLPRSAFPPVASAVYRRSAPPSVAVGPESRGPLPPISTDAQRFFPLPAPQHRSYSASAGDRRSTTSRSRCSETATHRSARPEVGPSDHPKGCIQPWTLLDPPPPLPGIKFQAPRPFNMPPTWGQNFMSQSSSDERQMSICKHLSRRSSSQPKSHPEAKGVPSSRRVFTNINFLSNKRDASYDTDNSGRRILSRSPARSLPPFTRPPSAVRKFSENLPPSKLMKITDCHPPGLGLPNSYNGTFYGRTFVGSPAWGGRVVQPSPSARRSAEASRAPRVFRRSTSVFPSRSHPHSAPPFARRSSQTRFDDQQSPFGSPEDTRPEPWKGLRDVNGSAEPFPYNNIFGIVPPNLRWDVPEERSEELFYKKERQSEKEAYDFIPGEIRAMHQKEHHEHNIEKSCYIFKYPFNHNEMKNDQTESNPPWAMKREPDKSYPYYFSADGVDYMKQQQFVSPKETDFVRPWKRHRGRSEELPPKQQFPRIQLPYSPTHQGARPSHQEMLANFDPENYNELHPASPFGTENMVYREPIDPELFDLPPDQPCLGHLKRAIQYEDDNSFRNMADENFSSRYSPQDLRMRTCKPKREWGVEASITIGERSSDQLSPAAAMKPMKVLPRDNSPCSPCPWPDRCNIALSFSFDKFGHADRNSLPQPCIEPPPDGMSPDPWVAPLNQAMVDTFAFAKPGKIQSPFPPIPTSNIPTSNIPRRKEPNLNSWRQPFVFSPRPPRDMTPQEIQLWQCQLNNEAFPFVPFTPDSFKPELFDSGACKDVNRREVFGEGPQQFESVGDLVSLDESPLQKNTDEHSQIGREERQLVPSHAQCWNDEMCVTGSRFVRDRSSENVITDRSPNCRQLISSSTDDQVEEVNSTTNIVCSELDPSLSFNESSLKDAQEMGKEPLVTILREKFQDDTKRRNCWDEPPDEHRNPPQYSPSQRRHNKEPFDSFRLGQQRVFNQLDNIEIWDDEIKNKSLQFFEEFSSSQQQHETTSNSLISARKRLLYAQDLLSQRKYSPPNSIKSLVGSKFGTSERYSDISGNAHNEFEPGPEMSPESNMFEPFTRNSQVNVKKSFQRDIVRISSADTRGKHLTMPQQIRTPMAPKEDNKPFHRQILQRSLNFQEFLHQRMIEQTPVLHQTPTALQHIEPFVPSALKMRLSSQEESFSNERILKNNHRDQYNVMDQNIYIKNSEFNNEEMNVLSLQGSVLQSLPEHKHHRKDSPCGEMNVQRPVCTSDSVSSISFHQSLCPASSSMEPNVINDNHQQRYLPIRRSLKFCKHPCCHHTSLSQNIFEEENCVSDSVDTSQQECVIKIIEPLDQSLHMTDRKTSASAMTEFSGHRESRNQSNASRNEDKPILWFNQTSSFQQTTEQHTTKDNVDFRHYRGPHKSAERRRHGIQNNDSRKERKAKEMKIDHTDISTLRPNKSHSQKRKDFNKPWKLSHRSEERSDLPKKLPWGDLPDAVQMDSGEKDSDSKDASPNNKPTWKPRTFRRRPWPRPPPGEGPLPSQRLLGGSRKQAAPRWKPNRLLAGKETTRKNFAEYSRHDTTPNASSPPPPPHSAHGRNQSHKTSALSSKPDKRRATSSKTISELYRSAPWVESQISLGNTPEANEPMILPSFTSKKELPTYNIVAAAVTAAVAIQATKDSKLLKGSASDAKGKPNLRDAHEKDAAPGSNKGQGAIKAPSATKVSSKSSSHEKDYSVHTCSPKSVVLPPKARASAHSGESVASYLSAHSHLAVQDPGDTSAPGSTRTLLPDDNSDANHKIESFGLASEASVRSNKNKNNTSAPKKTS